MSKSEAPLIFDFIGREIKVGDTVIYPVRRGSKMWMQKIKVTQLVPGTTPTLGGFNGEGRKITLHNLENVTVVEPLPLPAP
jgi:hypothetical protein